MHKHFAHGLRAALALALVAAVAVPVAEAHKAPVRDGDAAALLSRGAPERHVESLTRGPLTGGEQRQLGMDSGLLRRYWLRDPASRPTSAASPRSIASAWLASHATQVGLSGAIDDVLALAYEKESPSGTHLRWNQQVNGVPVYRSEIVVKVNKRGQVSSVHNNLVPGLEVATSAAITRERALATAVSTVKATGKALGDFTADLAVVPVERGARLAWIVSVPVDKPMGDWRVFVDAKTGDVFGVADEMRYATGSGNVFDPDPMSKLGDSTLTDQNDANTAVPFPAAYDLVTLPDITLNAGVYSLDGPYARLIDNESPTVAPVTATHPDSFRFQRNAQGFEDVMCYFHLDISQRWIQSLGFTNVNNRVQQVDSHGLNGDDNSHYVPSTGNLAFGEGGVDDDEDADVIWHEYGHSIQDNIVPGWGGGQEGQMGEGFGDYWGGSYSRSKFPNFRPMQFFTWDGNGEFWSGRRLIDTSKHYPEDCCGQVHASGTLWCSGLTDVWNQLGRTVTDRIVLDHHFALGTSATMADAANQIIQSDIDLYGGAHVGAIVARFDFWGFVNAEDFVPTITHTPLADVENVAGPYAVVATVTSVQPLAAGSPKLYWGHGASITDSVSMTPTANPNEYTANIPGPGSPSDVRYYLRASDTNGGTSYAPATAPATPYVFHVGADVTPPAIAHTPITVAPAISWPLSVNATVTDNLGVNTASVTVAWTLNAAAQTPFTLTRVGLTNNYSATFPAVSVAPGDAVTYHITAQDVATVPNTGRNPASGEHAFTITAALGTVLVLDDDDVAKRGGTKTVVEGKGKRVTTLTSSGDVGIQSANVIASWLNAMGYVATVEASATSNPATWPGYSFIVHSSGGSTTPVANATYRTALETYTAAGHKLLIEGGEVAYDALSFPAYPSFAANVLHGQTWNTDNAGALTIAAGQASHPIATTPNALPASIGVTYVSPNFGTQDAFVPLAPAYAVYGTTAFPASAGISVYDDNPAPQSGQIVVFAFDIKDVTDSTLAKQALENAARFLLASEAPPTSLISGRVAVGPAWGGAGITVTLQPGGASTSTNAAGEFAFPPQYARTYSVGATLAAYSGTPRIVTVADNASASVVLTLFPIAESNTCNNPALAIPDDDPLGVTNDIVVVPAFTVASVEVGVNISHTWRGDLVAELRRGATTVRLHNATGGSADNLIGTYPTTLTVSGPGALSDFFGQSSAGTWTLFLSDNAAEDTGTLNQWCLTLRGAADTTATVGVGPVGPQAFEFAPVWPNPARGGSMTMSFALPSSTHGRLALYDVTGRLVRVVADREFEAGRYVMAFDGRDGHGAALRPGLYLARFTTEGRTVSRRFVVTQ